MGKPLLIGRGRLGSSSYRSGFSRVELCAVLVILSILAAVLYPVFAKNRDYRNFTCASSLKQVGLAMMGYCQDNDERFPPAARPVPHKPGLFYGWATTHDAQGQTVVLADAIGATEADKRFYGSLLSPYFKRPSIFHCPRSSAPEGTVTYRYNDLAAGQSQGDFVAVSHSVLLSDGEEVAGNVGHDYAPTSDTKASPLPAVFSANGKVILGASLQAAAKRHTDGATYCFADGHVKWYRPQFIFFPSRFSDSPTHKDPKTGRVLGPDPAKLSPTAYNATFHIK